MEKNIVKQTKINLLYVVTSQVFTVALGVIKSLILPIIIPTVEEYGYWQIYLFYISYVLIFSLGFHEGLYLKYGGKDYKELPMEQVAVSIKIQNAFLLFWTVVAVAFVSFIEDENRRFAMVAVACTILLSGVTEIFLKLYQSTNQLQKYSKYMFLDKLMFTPVILILFLVGNAGFRLLIIFDLFIRFFITMLLVIDNKELIFVKGSWGKAGWIEWKEDTASGCKILTSNYMAILVTGLGRFMVERFGDISDYAYFSFGTTVTNLVLLLIGAVSLVLFPLLKKLDVNKYKEYYKRVTGFAVCCEAFFLFSYFIVYLLIQYKLTSYIPSLRYIPLLLVTVYLSGLESLTYGPFLRALRKEKQILLLNILSLLLFCVSAIPFFLLTKDIIVIPAAMVFAMLLKYILSKRYAERLLGVQKNRDMWMVFLILAGFLAVQMGVGTACGAAVYAGICFFSLFVYRSNIVYFLQIFWKRSGKK